MDDSLEQRHISVHALPMESWLSPKIPETDGYLLQSVDRNCCWVALPDPLARQLEDSLDPVAFPVVLLLLDVRYGSFLGRVCWCGEITPSNAIHISTQLADILELEDDQHVTVQVVRQVPQVKQVSLECVTAAEYSLMLAEWEFFQEQILSQGALVVRNQVLPVWLRNQQRPIHLIPLNLIPEAPFALMVVDTELLVQLPVNFGSESTPAEGSSTQRPRHQRQLSSEITEEGSVEAPSAGPSLPVRHQKTPSTSQLQPTIAEFPKRRKVRELRLQRPSAEMQSMLEATVKLDTHCELSLAFLLPTGSELTPMGCAKWFPEGLTITTAISSVLLMEPETAAEIGVEAGDYVWVSDKIFSESRISSDLLILCVLLSPSVAPGHCLMSEKSAADLGAIYCRSVYVMQARPRLINPETLDSILIQPIRADDAPSAADSSQKDDSGSGEKAQSFLKRVLADEMNVDAFNIAPPDPEKEASNMAYLLQKAHQVVEYWSKKLPAGLEQFMDSLRFGAMEEPDEELTSRLLLFLTALILGWIEAQIEAIRNLHSKWVPLSADHRNGVIMAESCKRFLNMFCLSPCLSMHFSLQESNGHSAPLDLMLQYTIGDNGPREGALIDATGLFRALKRDLCEPVLAGVLTKPMVSPDSIPAEFWNHQLPPWLMELSEKCLQYLKPALRVRDGCDRAARGLLVSGGHKSSKTSFVSGLCQKLAYDLDIMANVYYIPCRALWPSLQGSRRPFLDSKSKILGEVQLALQAAPSVVVLDDLDCWCTNGEDAAAATLPSSRTISMVQEMMQSAGAPIVFVATCGDVETLDASLFETGRFDCQFKMPSLTSAIRTEMVKHIFNEKGIQLHPAALDGMHEWDTGFEYADLERLVSRALRRHLQHQGEVQSCISQSDIQTALKDFTPAAQWNITKPENDATAKNMEDVGAMADVKKVLRDCIELPMVYPHLIKQCPVRLMSNVLLYGPPGSGKTFIVYALSVSLGVRMISVKGPELFNKYIGQSEAAVRSTFQQAREAAPCILFFDEFESLGPQRGVGVAARSSDRVVNQLLTEMDGVEVLTGVCVIGATSRPDLIDKALLRPGRLDRHVYCGLPDIKERQEILKAATRRQNLDPTINLDRIARATDGYSGADLSAIVSEAHLHAVEGYLETPGAAAGDPPEITISAHDIDYALHHSRRSVNEREHQFLDEIYSEFSGKRSNRSRAKGIGLRLAFA